MNNEREVNLVVFWTFDTIKGELSKIEAKIQFKTSPYEYPCKKAAYVGNKVATQYYFQKLTSKERISFITEIARYTVAFERDSFSNTYTQFHDEFFSDILCTLLTLMDNEQQTEIFEYLSFHFLVSFLDWPWQSVFGEAASYLWTFLSEDMYGCVLRRMINKVVLGFKDFDYQKLLEENWRQSPDAYKRSALNQNIDILLSKLFHIGDVDNIKLILHDATIAEKQKIISSDEGLDICKDLIRRGKWSSFKLFIQECVSSREEMAKFKADFRESIKLSKFQCERMKDKWDKFFSVLDEITYESNKRKIMEDDDNEVKRRDTEF